MNTETSHGTHDHARHLHEPDSNRSMNQSVGKTLVFSYEKSVHPARIGLGRSPGLNAFIAEEVPRRMHAFMLYWTAHSIAMTEQVENWIRRAGEKCEDMSFKKIGQHLKRHAEHEARHDEMLVADLDVLVALWNRNYDGRVTAQELRSMKMLPATKRYIDLHENTIAGSNPFCQIAIEFEIERLSIMFGPRMVENVLYTLGQEFDSGMTFLTHHVVLDQGHTQFNSKLIEKCLEENPERLNALVATGREALDTYGSFLTECWNASQTLAQ